MLYWYTYLVLVYVFRAVFKRAFFNGVPHLEPGKPVIIAANHTNAFLDAVLIAAQVNRSVNFLVRSDVFNTAVKRFFLHALHQIPIYRQRDGRDALTKNQETFKKVYELLEQNRVIMIFPEADCFPIKRLRPLKKGTARMAFGVMDKNNWDFEPYILPVGINYTHHTKLRTEVMVGFDKPISIKDYEDLYKENPAKATNQLTQDISEGIKRQLIHIPEHLETISEQLLTVYRSNLLYNPINWRRDDNSRLSEEKMVIDKVTETATKDDVKLSEIKEKATKYFQILAEQNLTDKAFWAAANSKKVNLLTYLFAPIFFPVYLLIKPIWNYINRFVEQKIKKGEFKLSLKMGLTIGFYQVFILIGLAIFWPLYGFWWAVVGLFLFWLLSWGAILFIEAHQANKLVWNAKKWKKSNPEEFKSADELRAELVDFLP